MLIIISGPSGVGKGSLLKPLKEKKHNLAFSVSYTTRKARDGEVDGVNYIFTSVENFRRMTSQGEFLEWVEYCDNYYGTPRAPIDKCIREGKNIILEIEVEGARKVMAAYPEAIGIFILPPAFLELASRLEMRSTETKAAVRERLAKALTEIAYAREYHYIVVNDKLEEATGQVLSIIETLAYTAKNNEKHIKKLEKEGQEYINTLLTM